MTDRNSPTGTRAIAPEDALAVLDEQLSYYGVPAPANTAEGPKGQAGSDRAEAA
jgi:hypothetical protein